MTSLLVATVASAIVTVSSIAGSPEVPGGSVRSGLLAAARAIVAAPSPSQAVVRYRPPTDAPIIDGFRPPPAPWLAGNRGLEYATVPGSVVGAIGVGIVAFAGPVAGRLVVTVDHPDGLRSSYVGLAGAAVTAGQPVTAGTPVGLAGARLHLGVRRGERYLDPASLWAPATTRRHVFLVPVAGDLP